MRVVGSVRFFVHHINHKEPMCDFSSYTKCIVHSTSRLLHRIFHQTKRAKTTLEECIIYRQQNFKRKSKDIRYNCFHHFKMSVMQHLHIYSFFLVVYRQRRHLLHFDLLKLFLTCLERSKHTCVIGVTNVKYYVLTRTVLSGIKNQIKKR